MTLEKLPREIDAPKVNWLLMPFSKRKPAVVTRRVHDAGQAVTITSDGTPLVRIEAIRETNERTGYGPMRGTVDLLVADDELISARDHSAWRTLEKWDEATTL